MIISLDYDNTYTRDPEGWFKALSVLKQQGHTIIGVTMRFDRETSDMLTSYGELCDKIYFTGRHQKRRWLNHRNVFPDVWIDDSPEFIVDWTTL